VLILKEDKVVCFDTLLQVLILKVDMGTVAAGERDEESSQWREKIEGKDNAETQRTQSWRRDREERSMPPPAFGEKRPQAIENKG
jgi:hypothetical protein